MATEEKKSFIRVCVTCGMQVEGDATVCPEDGSILSQTMKDPLIGLTLMDKYEVHSVLGRGGMSAVYKARHILMDRWVALKVLRSDLVHDPLVLKRFQVESKAASLLRHPNAITVYDFGVTPDQGIPYLVMDYLEGKDLSAIIRDERQIAPARCVYLMIQACNALAHAHAKGVVHRDIKPSNLLVTIEEDGLERLRVVDFGIAKILNPEGSDITKLTTTGDIFGSPAYMSPEQCHGQVADARSDIYSLGGVIYESLMGTAPLRGTSTIDMILKQVSDMPPAFSVVRPDLKIPGALEAVVFKAIAKNPEHRYATMADLSTALSEAMASVSPNKAAITLPTYSILDDDSHDRTRPAMTAKTAASESLSNAAPAPVSADAGQAVDVRQAADAKSSAPSPMVASFDLFGNQMLMPAASDDLITEKVEKVRQDVGSLFGSESGTESLRDSGSLFGTNSLKPASADAPRADAGDLFPAHMDVELKDVGNIFGSEKLLPAVAELPTTAVAKTGDRGGLIVDPLSGQGDTGGSGASYGGAYNGAGNQSAASNASSQVAFSSTPGKTSTTTIVIAAVSALVVSALAALLIVKFVPPVRDFVATSQPQLASALGIETATATIVAPIAHGNGSKDDAANTIYQQARNSVVTLKVVSKAYLLTFEGDPLPDVNGHKIYAGKDQDDNVHFYKNGKPTSQADGELLISKVHVAFSVGFKNGNLTMELFKPGTTEILMIKGHPAILTKGLELSGVTTEVTGTGFYVRPDVVCTNFGVVANPRLNTVTKWIGGDAQIGNSNAKIELDNPPIIVDEKHDLALLNVPSPLSSPLKLNTDLSQLQPGQKVYALGAPQGYDLSLAPGVVSSDRLRDGINLAEGTDKLYIQHSAKIDAGNNGGPLFNDKGEVIGVNADYVGNGSINLAVAGKYVTDLLDQPDIQKKIEDINKARTPDLGK